jgi:hypothetical protein
MSTYGERAVGLSFNPSDDKDVERIKKLYAEIIDFCHNAQKDATAGKSRLFAIAITEAQGAQMWAVKAITWSSE